MDKLKAKPTPKTLSIRDMRYCYEGKLDKIKEIVKDKSNAEFLAAVTDDQGNQVEGVSPYTITLLTCACVVANVPIVELLLSYNVNLEVKNQDGETPLIQACNDFRTLDRNNMPEGSEKRLSAAKKNPLPFIADRTTVARMLINKGANIRVVAKFKKQPIHYASGNGFNDILNLLLDKGADINAIIVVDDMTPLHMACLHEPLYIDVIITLLRRGADRTMRTRDGKIAQEHLEASRLIPKISDEYRAQIDTALRLFDPESPDYVPPSAPQQAPNSRAAAEEDRPPQAPNPRAAEKVPPQEPMDSRAEDVPFPVIPVRPPDIPVVNQLQARVLLVWDVYHNAMNMLNHFTDASRENPELNIIVSELGIFTKTLFFIIQNIIPQLETKTNRREVLQHMQVILPKDLSEKCMFILNNNELINKLFADNETFSNYATLDVRVTSETIQQNNKDIHFALLRDKQLSSSYQDLDLYRGGKRKRKRYRKKTTRKKYKSKRKYSVRK